MIIQLKRVRSCLLVAAVACLSVPAWAELSANQAATLYDEKTSYAIFRNGKQVGRHTLSISNTDGEIQVDVDSRITITILKVPVFKFHYKSRETWRNNNLYQVSSSTRTNSDIEKASLLNDGNASLMIYNGTQTASPVIAFASNHWHAGVLQQQRVFNTIKGEASNINIARLQEQVLSIDGQKLNATHYRYTGDIEADVWYDQDQRWVKLAFKGTDGSDISYVLTGTGEHAS